MNIRYIKDFFRLESASGILLVLAALCALLIKNSPIDYLYEGFLTTPVMIQFGEFIIDKPLVLWINDGLMMIFFLLVGLEIKREVIEGELSSIETISLPAIAALGGIVVPALIYVGLNWNDPVTLQGWAIPVATDIAFALGVVILLGDRVPSQLKLLLLAIATFDDIGAIIIIALFYTSNLSLVSFGLALLAVAALYIINRAHITHVATYIIIGVILWACVLKSGVHATLAGVVLAMFIPHKHEPHRQSMLSKLEHDLHPYVAYAVLPLFAFANAGVSLKGLSLDSFTTELTLGIILGLFVGKQIGIMLFSGIAIKAGWCKFPRGVHWPHFYGLTVIAGIGFTMSLFIGTLVFTDAERLNAMRLGVLSASLISALVGASVLIAYDRLRRR